MSQQSKHLPKIAFWHDRIDTHVVSFHAVRCWDLPSNGVFLLTPFPTCGYFSWSERQDIISELTRRLVERERILFNWYGRAWRHHLCERISLATKMPIPV